MSDWITRALIGARFMAPPEGAVAADGAAPASPPPAAAPPSPAPAAATANGGGEAIPAGGQPAPADSTPAADSASLAESPSLLSLADAAAKAAESPPAPEAKPAEAKAPDAKPPDAKPAEASPDPAKDATPSESKDHAESTDQAPALLTLEDLTLPEEARAAPELQAFVDLLNNRELSDKDRAQGLWDLHHKDLERAYAEVADRQTKFWKQLQREWQEELRADREIGGNRLETSLGKVVGLVAHYLPGKEGELFLKHTDANGMGNYGPFIRMMVKIADERSMYEDLRMGSGLVPPTSPPRQRNAGSRGWYDKSIDRVD